MLQLSLDLIEEWSLNHPEASICTSQGASQFRRIANFQDYHGLPEFREVIKLPLLVLLAIAHKSIRTDTAMQLAASCLMAPI
jgi:hypothetical protein